jgi:hypothetical protein
MLQLATAQNHQGNRTCCNGQLHTIQQATAHDATSHAATGNCTQSSRQPHILQMDKCTQSVWQPHMLQWATAQNQSTRTTSPQRSSLSPQRRSLCLKLPPKLARSSAVLREELLQSDTADAHQTASRSNINRTRMGLGTLRHVDMHLS